MALPDCSDIIQIASNIATVAAVLSGGIWALRLYRNESEKNRSATHLQIFMAYTQRYQDIMDKLPGDLRGRMFDLEQRDMDAKRPEIRGVLVNYLNLCSEEYAMKSRIENDIWEIWEGEMRAAFKSPVMDRLWESDLKKSHKSAPEFVRFVDGIRSEGGQK